MALDKDVYKALEAVVGPRYVTEDPGILTGYQYAIGYPFGRWTPAPPAAVVLPENTTQVRGIVKVCSRYNVKFKAHSTGYFAFGFPGMEGVITVDLRRMNKIIDIDERNMFAIIEPYAVAGQIQAEAMKRGLDCHIISAGPTHSPLASCTSMWGIGGKGLTTSWNERNLFGVEWVLPTGELVRLGSAAVGAGWFSADGPGPSLRGIMRGSTGAFGANGIFTRIGLKLYPWQGSEQVQCTGKHPQIGMKIPENMHFAMPYWEDWEKMADATYKMVDNNVAFSLLRMPPEQLNVLFTETNDMHCNDFRNGTLPISRKDHLCHWQVIIAGHSKREFSFKRKLFEQIVKDTDGQYVPLTPEQDELVFASNVRVGYVSRTMRLTGDLGTSYGFEESINLIGKLHRTGARIMGKYTGPGKLLDHGPEGFWSWLNEGRSLHSENAFSTYPGNPMEGAPLKYVMETMMSVNSEGLGVHILPGYVAAFADILGPMNFNANVWMRKIKYEVVDPDNLADHTDYIHREPFFPEMPSE